MLSAKNILSLSSHYLVHPCLEALEKVLLSAQSYIAASVKDLKIQVSKPNDSIDSVNYAIFFKQNNFLCANVWKNINMKILK